MPAVPLNGQWFLKILLLLILALLALLQLLALLLANFGFRIQRLWFGLRLTTDSLQGNQQIMLPIICGLEATISTQPPPQNFTQPQLLSVFKQVF